MILWLGEILHHESLFWGSHRKQSKPNRSRGWVAPFSNHLSHNPGDHSNNLSPSSSHWRSPVCPLYRGMPRKTDIIFRMKRCSKQNHMEYVFLHLYLFLKEGLGLGPRVFLGSLPYAKTWSTLTADLNVQHSYFCLIAAAVHFWVTNQTYRDSQGVPIQESAGKPRDDAGHHLSWHLVCKLLAYTHRHRTRWSAIRVRT